MPCHTFAEVPACPPMFLESSQGQESPEGKPSPHSSSRGGGQSPTLAPRHSLPNSQEWTHSRALSVVCPPSGFAQIRSTPFPQQGCLAPFPHSHYPIGISTSLLPWALCAGVGVSVWPQA